MAPRKSITGSFRWPLPESPDFPDFVRDLSTAFSTKPPTAAASRARILMPQQELVRTFLSGSSRLGPSPYRGLILYHGLGSGKTCAAVAAATAATSGTRSVVVMLPASLEANFRSEIEPCSSKLASFRFVRYNGLTEAAADRLLREQVFEGAVIIIDEAHNFVQAASNGGVVRRLYEAIVAARKCKVMLLSGTPLVNSAHEVAFMVNMIAGLERTRTVTLDAPPSASKIDSLRKSPLLRSVEATIVGRGLLPAVRVQMVNPDGFELVREKGKTHLVLMTGDKGRRAPEDVASLLGVDRAVWDRAPEDHVKVLPDDREEFDARFVDTTSDKEHSLRKDALSQLRAQLVGRISFFEGHDASVYPTLRKFVIVRTHLSAHQFAVYSHQRATEIRRELAAKKRKGGDANGGGMVYRPFTRAACNFAFPHDMPRPYRGVESASYEASLTAAVARLADRPERLRLKENASGVRDASGESGERYTLDMLSTKFARVLQYLRGDDEPRRRPMTARNTTTKRSDPIYPILEAAGTADNAAKGGGGKGNIPAIVYSQFRAAEGVSIFAEVLRANGYGELTCFSDPVTGELRVRRTPGSGPRVADNLTFIVYSTDKPPEHNELMLAVFNNRIADLSPVVQTDLRATINAKSSSTGRRTTSTLSNLRGELAAVLLISKSGAEGLSTRNVRTVHVMEPFWHANRIEQVVGRARRAHSHDQLPPDERFVDVFVHMATFSREQASLHGGPDAGKTADEFVHEVAQNKRRLLRSVREVLKGAAIEQPSSSEH